MAGQKRDAVSLGWGMPGTHECPTCGGYSTAHPADQDQRCLACGRAQDLTQDVSEYLSEVAR